MTITNEEFEQVMTQQRPYLLNRAMNHLNSEAMAEELVQDAMLDVWQAIQAGRLSEENTLEGYVHQAVIWRLGKRHKRNKMERELVTQFTVPPRNEDYEVEDESEAVEYYEKPWIYHPDGSEANLQLDVHKALNALDESDRLIAKRHYLEGWTYAELGEVEGRTWQSVKWQLTRISKELRKMLAEYQSATSISEFI